MTNAVFISLSVKNLKRSRVFFRELGFRFNPQFSDANAVCMVIRDGIYALLLTESYLKNFTSKRISDARRMTEVLITMHSASKADIQWMITRAQMLGASIYCPPQDCGWMYHHCFADLDGHQWELVYLDADQLPIQ